MCFSAEASFTVSSALTIVGITTLSKVRHYSLLMIAFIPLLFAVQQFSEGIVWLHIDEELQRTPISLVAQYTYLFFAWIVWPMYIPLCLLIPERVQWRYAVCFFCLLVGVYITLHDSYYLLTNPVTAKELGNSISYNGGPLIGQIIYAIPTILPLFTSSLPRIWTFGVWLIVSFIGSEIVFRMTFTSVWCFFAAAVSIVLAKVLIDVERKTTL